MAISFSSLSGGGASFRQVTEIITSTQAWVAPADVTEVEVWVFGGGGAGATYESTGGAYTGGGGGGGGCGHKNVAVTPEASYTVTIGAGGAGVSGTMNSTIPFAPHGADSSFGTLVVGFGGQGGSAQNDEMYFDTGGVVVTGAGLDVGSGGGRGLGGYTWYQGAGGGGGAGSAAASNRPSTTSWAPNYGRYGQGWSGALGHGQSNGYTFNGLICTGGSGIIGFGGGGGGGIGSHDFVGNDNAVYSVLKYRGTGQDGGGTGAMDIYNKVLFRRTAENGATNTGGGGGGGVRTNWFTSNSGAGGSGVCVIKYWTAL